MLILLVPYPALGHITPMLTLASDLSKQRELGLEPVIVLPEFIHRHISPPPHITCLPIHDGLEGNDVPDFFAIARAMENIMPLHFENLITKLNRSVIGCVVVDVLASWAIGVAHRCGIHVSGFWPAMLSTYHLIKAIPFMLTIGIISESGIPAHDAPIFLESGQFTPTTEDLPWLIGAPDSRYSRFKFWTIALERSKTLKSILVNTYPDECAEKLIDNPNDSYSPPVLLVGPLINQWSTCVKNGLREEDTSCLTWLDKQTANSVIYISFGSWVNPIQEEKVRSLALALEVLKLPFIWVLGNEWRRGLPDGYLERLKQGIIVSWAPQIKVLRHESVGCYLTHCGWNSILEAIKYEKKMLCYPIAGDQFLNCGYVVKVWRIGMRINGFEEKVMEECVKKLMNDEHMKERLVIVKKNVMGKEASLIVMDNLASFVDTIKCLN